MFKKALAGLATVALALGMVALTATSASAHHNDIVPTISCTDDYQFQVDWAVSNSETLTETITASSDTALVPVGTSFGNKETKVFTEYFGAPTAKTLTLSAKWSNNNTNTSSGSIKKNDFPNCEPNHVPVTICHATPPDTAAQGWEEITIDDDAIVKSGHNEQHNADIIPAFDYWEKVDGVWTLKHFDGKNLGTSFSGIPGSSILGSGCSYTTTPAVPTFSGAVCDGPGQVGDGSYTIPSTLGVRYEVSINGAAAETTAAGTYYEPVGTTIEVWAYGDPDWVGVNEPTYWSYTVPEREDDCIYEATPVAPTVTPIEECDQYGSVVPQQTEGVVYEFVQGDGTEGYWQIKATPANGYKFDGDQVVYFDGNVGEYTECVTPTAPGFVDSECTGPGTQSGGSYTIPETEGVLYEVKIGDEPWVEATAGDYPVTVYPTTVQVRATAEDGYELVGYDEPWSHTFESAGECLTLASPVEPKVVVITECGEYGSVTPADTIGVVYTLTSGDGKSGAWEITATPADGYYFEGDQEVVFSGNLGVYTDCATAAAVTFTNQECVPFVEVDASAITPAIVGDLVDGMFEIPATEGVQYTVSINGGAFEDYEAGSYPADNGDVVVVQAHAKPGYTLTGTTEWEHTFVAYEGECDPPTLGEVFPAASATNQTCTASGTIVLKPTEHVIYSIDGVEVAQGTIAKAAGTYTVTAKTDSPLWGIFGPTEWELTIAGVTVPCGSNGTGLLASTGSYLPILGLSAAAGLVVLGGVILVMRRRTAAE
ncbi:hypothetical protein [Schumannella luteola]